MALPSALAERPGPADNAFIASNLVPDEILVATSSSEGIGDKLLTRMGWRPGRGIAKSTKKSRSTL